MIKLLVRQEMLEEFGEEEHLLTHFFQVCLSDTLDQAILLFTEERSQGGFSYFSKSDIQIVLNEKNHLPII